MSTPFSNFPLSARDKRILLHAETEDKLLKLQDELLARQYRIRPLLTAITNTRVELKRAEKYLAHEERILEYEERNVEQLTACIKSPQFEEQEEYDAAVKEAERIKEEMRRIEELAAGIPEVYGYSDYQLQRQCEGAREELTERLEAAQEVLESRNIPQYKAMLVTATEDRDRASHRVEIGKVRLEIANEKLVQAIAAYERHRLLYLEKDAKSTADLSSLLHVLNKLNAELGAGEGHVPRDKVPRLRITLAEEDGQSVEQSGEEDGFETIRGDFDLKFMFCSQ